ncbi:MAG: MCE family protein [Deltaproteobacteria bacterium]|nr:MCE family protein [Deltaproteobacteria bacterium]
MDKITGKDARFRGLEVKVGILVASAVAGMAVIIILIGIQKDIFTHKYHISFTSESGAGFNEGMPVKLSGFKIGRIQKIELTDAARVKVTLEINRKYEQWVRNNSFARMGKEGLIGDTFIEIALGGPGGNMLKDGDEISYYKTGGMEELVAEAKPILNEVKDIIHYVNDPKGDLKASIANIREFTAELKETRRSIDRTVKDADAAIVQAKALISGMDAKTGPVIASVARVVGSLEAVTRRVDGILEKTNSTAEKLDGAMDGVKTLTGALAQDTPKIRGLIENASLAASEGKGLIKGVKAGWVGRLTAPPPQEAPALIPLDAYPRRPPAPEAAK